MEGDLRHPKHVDVLVGKGHVVAETNVFSRKPAQVHYGSMIYARIARDDAVWKCVPVNLAMERMLRIRKRNPDVGYRIVLGNRNRVDARSWCVPEIADLGQEVLFEDNLAKEHRVVVQIVSQRFWSNVGFPKQLRGIERIRRDDHDIGEHGLALTRRKMLQP